MNQLNNAMPLANKGVEMGSLGLEMPQATAQPNAIARGGEHRNPKFAAGLAAGVLLAGSLVGIASCSGESDKPEQIDQVGQINGAELADLPVCEQVFAEGAFKATDESFGNELTVRPESPLKDNKQLFEYKAGENGTMCNSAVDLSATSAVLRSMGAGNLGVEFQNYDLNAMTESYVNDPERAARDIDTVGDYIKFARPNEEALTGPLYRIGKKDENSIEAVFIEVTDNQFEAGSVYVMDYTTVINDGNPDSYDTAQKLIFDPNTGQMYTTKGIGAEIIQEQQEQDQNQEQNNGGTGGGTFGESLENGESDQAGNVPESGGHEGYTPGTAPSYGPGTTGTTQPGGEGGPTTSTTRPGTTTTTRPGTTTTTRPSTTTTTQPTTTTTRPVIKPPVVGCDPEFEDCE